MTRFTILILTACAAHAQPAPWVALFQQSDQARSAGNVGLAVGLAESAWQAVRAAGPKHPEYRRAVNRSANHFQSLGRLQRAESIFVQAVQDAQPDAGLVREMRIMQALFLESHLKEVEADDVRSAVLTAEASAQERSSQYAAELIEAGALKEKLGKPNEAETLYRLAVTQPPSVQSEWTRLEVVIGRLRSRWSYPDRWNATGTLADFYNRHGRFEEALQVLNEDRPSDANARWRNISQRVRSLAQQGKWNEAIEMQRDLISFLGTQKNIGSTYTEQYTLTRLQEAAGREDEIVADLKSAADAAAREKGVGSREYRGALTSYAQRLRLREDTAPQAAAVWEEVLALGGQDAWALGMLSSAYTLMRQPDRAREYGERAEQVRREWAVRPAENPTLAHRARNAIISHEFDEARELVEQAFDAAETHAPRNSVLESGELTLIPKEYLDVHKPDEAKSAALRYLALAERFWSFNWLSLRYELERTARFFQSAGFYEDAWRLQRRMEREALEYAGPRSREMEAALELRGDFLCAQKEMDAYRRNLEERLTLAAQIHGADSYAVVKVERDLASALGNREEARGHWIAVVEHSRKASAGYGAEHAAWVDQARQYFAAREPELAARLAEEARKARAARWF
jgi:hypothetical protein